MTWYLKLKSLFALNEGVETIVLTRALRRQQKALKKLYI